MRQTPFRNIVRFVDCLFVGGSDVVVVVMGFCRKSNVHQHFLLGRADPPSFEECFRVHRDFVIVCLLLLQLFFSVVVVVVLFHSVVLVHGTIQFNMSSA